MHLYEVEKQGQDMIDQIILDLDKQEHEKRLLVVNANQMKMDRMEKTHTNLIIADFCKFRETGPGLASTNKETTQFDIEDDEGFGEVTSLLLTADQKHVIVLYNHYGYRASAIAQYLSECATETEFSFSPALKKNVLEKIKKQEKFQMISTTLDFSKQISGENISALLGKEHFSNIHEVLSSFGKDAVHINVEIRKSRERNSSLDSQFTKQYLEDTLSLSEEGIVVSSKVRTQEGILDLVQAKEFLSVDIEWDEADRMIPFESKKRALARAYVHWHNKGFIDVETDVA